MIGGHFVSGELRAIPEDLPEAVLKIIRDACHQWDFDGETTVKFTLKPNAELCRPEGGEKGGR